MEKKKSREPLDKRDVACKNGHLTSVCDKFICTCLDHTVLCRDENTYKHKCCLEREMKIMIELF